MTSNPGIIISANVAIATEKGDSSNWQLTGWYST